MSINYLYPTLVCISPFEFWHTPWEIAMVALLVSEGSPPLLSEGGPGQKKFILPKNNYTPMYN